MSLTTITTEELEAARTCKAEAELALRDETLRPEFEAWWQLTPPLARALTLDTLADRLARGCGKCAGCLTG